MNISYQILLQTIESFASEHLQIKKFSSDFPEQLPNFATKDEAYPILFVSPSTSIANLNTKTFNVNIYCYDIIQQDRANINSILSDTHSILNDLVIWLNADQVPSIDIVNSSTIEPINNALLDYCAGWTLRLTVEVDNSTICDIPFNEMPAIIEIKNEIIYSKYLTCETLAECPVIVDIQNSITGATSDTFVTGATYSSGTSIFTNNKGETFNLRGYMLSNVFLDTYLGNRLTPTETSSNGYTITKSINGQIGYYVRNTDNNGNGALASISVLGSGSTLYDKGISMNTANNGYFINYLKNSSFIYSDLPTNIVGQSLDFRFGALATATSAFKIDSSGTLSIGVKPTVDNTQLELLARKSDGTVTIVNKTTKTSELINDGDDGLSHFISMNDLPSNIILYPTTIASDVSSYFKLVSSITDPDYNTVAVDVPTGVISTTNQLISSLVTVPNIIVGNPGVFNITVIGNITRTSGTGSAEFYFEVYKRTSGGTESLITTSDVTLPVLNTGYSEFSATALWNDGVFLSTDRIVLKFYGSRIPTGSNPSYNFMFGGSTPVRTLVPIPLAVVPTNITLNDVVDVVISSPLNNQLLTYETASGLWKNKTPQLEWDYLVTKWSVMPTVNATISSGDVWNYTLGGITRYRLVPATYDATQDSFYTTFDGTTLSGLITSRG